MGKRIINYIATDYEKFREAMIDLIPQKLPEWTDRSEADFGIVLIELFAYIADILGYYEDRIGNESFLATVRERRRIIRHLQTISYELAGPASASGLLSLILSNRKIEDLIGEGETNIQIEKGAQFATKSSETRKIITFEYVGEQPLTIGLDEFKEDSSGEKGFKKYVGIPVVQGKTVSNEKTGISDGSPNQVFELSRPRMIRGSLKLQARTPDRVNEWLLRSSLVFSQHDDKHYFVQTDENGHSKVIFGDGLYGQIPEKGAEIIATYRIGGGIDGNVGAREITVISNAPRLQALRAKVTNEMPASEGKERKSIEHTTKLVTQVFRFLNRVAM